MKLQSYYHLIYNLMVKIIFFTVDNGESIYSTCTFVFYLLKQIKNIV
jgi:hypothetical protein